MNEWLKLVIAPAIEVSTNESGAPPSPVACRGCQDVSERATSQFYCPTRPDGPDGHSPTFTDADHLTPEQVNKYHKTGAHHRPVACRACHDVRARERSHFICSMCPKGADGHSPTFTEADHLTPSQVKKYRETGAHHN